MLRWHLLVLAAGNDALKEFERLELAHKASEAREILKVRPVGTPAHNPPIHRRG